MILTLYKANLTSINTLSTLTNMYQGDTENTSFPGIGNTSFPNFDSLDKKTHEYISQPHWDHKKLKLMFPRILLLFLLPSYMNKAYVNKQILLFAWSKIYIRDFDKKLLRHLANFSIWGCRGLSESVNEVLKMCKKRYLLM